MIIVIKTEMMWILTFLNDDCCHQDGDNGDPGTLLRRLPPQNHCELKESPTIQGYRWAGTSLPPTIRPGYDRHAGNNHNHEYMLKNTKLFLLNIYENKLQSDSNNNKQQVHEYEVPTGIFLQTATFFAVEPDLSSIDRDGAD